MASDWPSTTLAELCVPDRGITYGIVKVGDFIPGGVPIIRGGDIRDGRVCFDDVKRVAREISNQFRRTILRGGELVMNLISEPGHVALVPLEFAGFNVSRDVAVIALSDRIDHKFALYFLKSRMATGWFTARLQGSVTEKINLGTLSQIPVPLPPRHVQEAIAHILGTLDDKIELNRRMNETLEGMARAIFKSWFVDFDPVRAKCGTLPRGTGFPPVRGDKETIRSASTPHGQDAQATSYVLPKPIADLFPDSFVDSELGEIPKGWKVRSLDEDFNLTMGQSPPGKTYNELGEGVPFYQGCTDFGCRYPRRRVFCTAPTRFAKAGDTLVSVRAPVGRINMASEDCAIGRGVAAVRHDSGSRSYTYFFVHSLNDTFARFEAEGTVFGCIGKKDFHAIRCIVPPRQIVQSFEGTVSRLDDRTETVERESRTLAAIRDALLPKLLSGEIRVADAETEIRRAGV